MPLFVFSVLNLIVAGIVGLTTKNYKYFKLSLKIMTWIIVIMVFTVLIFSVKMFLGKTLGF